MSRDDVSGIEYFRFPASSRPHDEKITEFQPEIGEILHESPLSLQLLETDPLILLEIRPVVRRQYTAAVISSRLSTNRKTHWVCPDCPWDESLRRAEKSSFSNPRSSMVHFQTRK
jgi:hypothetical protein